MADVVSAEELTALVQAIKFAHPAFSLKQVHATVLTHGGLFANVPLARVKKYLKKLGLMGNLEAGNDEPVSLMTVGGESKSTPAPATAAAPDSDDWMPMALDEPVMFMGSHPHQATIRMNHSTAGAAHGALGELYKIQKAMGSSDHPMLVYNKDRSRKTFLHPTTPAYRPVVAAIDRVGAGGVGVGGTKAYFYGRVQGTTLFINTKTLAPAQSW
ncbi:hypothetical protein SPRG_01184 [Saprolegnia parasitica CBS 223.65]|uniref:Uncharacterized protein n=1 Tax=Saprolegnia parasitica (strain CBS 223.65) TaxID=695850 RepID=A0A067D7Y8_SAPPC|nr:hypothetical protein SPRG_01184 [Saprolegnia parasitica CBS 223.65]KDO35117.1 hypothetical protein SPRG_01184 [Saprolegnia parasitica CBS 223.65]|eukprot:XP_012194766.1 hypothetical protein SPRG_01184 [Saprolegnia parasitica CBS 223.65]